MCVCVCLSEDRERGVGDVECGYETGKIVRERKKKRRALAACLFLSWALLICSSGPF